MIRILRDDHVREHGLGRQATLDQMRRGRRLHDLGAAVRTGVARPHRDEDPVLRRHDVEALRTILADAHHVAAAARAADAVGLDHPLDLGQMLRQGTRLTLRPILLGLLGCLRPPAFRLLGLADRHLDVLERQRHLVGVELLRGAAEPRAPELLDEVLQAGDMDLEVGDLRLEMLPRRALDHDPLAFDLCLRALSPDQLPQRVGRQVLEIGRLAALQHGCSVAAEAARRHRMVPN